MKRGKFLNEETIQCCKILSTKTCFHEFFQEAQEWLTTDTIIHLIMILFAPSLGYGTITDLAIGILEFHQNRIYSRFILSLKVMILSQLSVNKAASSWLILLDFDFSRTWKTLGNIEKNISPSTMSFLWLKANQPSSSNNLSTKWKQALFFVWE